MAGKGSIMEKAKPEDVDLVMGGKTPSKYTDPCRKAAAQSMKCLEDNSYNREKCFEVFREYRECKKLWIAQRREDRINGKAF